MTFYKILVIVFFWVVPQLIYGQEEDSIRWNIAAKLNWSDFQSSPDTTLEWKAVSSITISANGFNENGLPNFEIVNSFIRSKSWSKDKSSQSLLEHEQLHFDIAEVYARKMRKSITLCRDRKIKNYESYSAIIQKLAADRDKLDKQYDEECYYGTFLSNQEKWRARITKELDALKKYASDMQ